MATLITLKATLHRLNQAKEKRKSLKVTRTEAVKKLIEILQEKHLVEILSDTSNEVIIQPAKEASMFGIVEDSWTVTKSKLLTLAAAVLPSVTGCIILTTRKGVLTHHEAVTEGIGGQVIGFAY